MQKTEIIPFVHRGDIVVKLKDLSAPAACLWLNVRQGGEEKRVAGREYAAGVYFVFQPLNHAPRLQLSFERRENGVVVETRQKTLQAVLLTPDHAQTVRFQEFAADFGATSVREPTALLFEPVALQPELPLLAGPVRSGPVHFAFFDAVHYMFAVPPGTHLPRQLGIFKYNPAGRRWTYVATRRDHAAGFLSARVLTAGTFALLRDSFPPEVSLRKLGSRHLDGLKHLFVRLTDKGKGIDDASIKVYLNGRRSEGDFDPDWSHFELADLKALKKGRNSLLVRAADLAGNRVEKQLVFTLK